MIRAPGWLQWLRRLQGMRDLHQRYTEAYRVACLAGLPMFSRTLDRALLLRAPQLWRSRLVHAAWCTLASAPVVALMAWFSVEGQLPEAGQPLPPVLPLDQQSAYLAVLVGLAWGWAVSRYPAVAGSASQRVQSFCLHLLSLLVATVPVLVFQTTLSLRIAHVLPAAEVERAVAFHGAHGFWTCRAETSVPEEDRSTLVRVLGQLQGRTDFSFMTCRPDDLSALAGLTGSPPRCDAGHDQCLSIMPLLADSTRPYWTWLGLLRAEQARWAAGPAAVLVPYGDSSYRLVHAVGLLLLVSGASVPDLLERARRSLHLRLSSVRMAWQTRNPGQAKARRPGRIDRWLLLHHPGAWAASPHRYGLGLLLACVTLAAFTTFGVRFLAGGGLDATAAGVFYLCAVLAFLVAGLDLAGLSRPARLGDSVRWLHTGAGLHFSEFRTWVVAAWMSWPAALALTWACGRAGYGGVALDLSDGEKALFRVGLAVTGMQLLSSAAAGRLALVLRGRMVAAGVVLASLPLSALALAMTVELMAPGVLDGFWPGAACMLVLHACIAAYLARHPADSSAGVPERLRWLAWICLTMTPGVLTAYVASDFLLLGELTRRYHWSASPVVHALGAALAVTVLVPLVQGLACGPALRLLRRARADPEV